MFRNKKSKFETPTGDRGRTPYFHGRSGIIQKFDRILTSAVAAREGTIQLIQGAPGVGKTALVDQMEKLAKRRGWKSVEIDPQALWDVTALREFFPDKNLFRKITAKFTDESGSVSVGMNIEWSTQTIRKMLHSGSRRPLLLILDEAQMLGSSSKPVGAKAEVASSVLKAIHNGKMRTPIMLIAAGLRTTLPSLQALDVSRFGERNKVSLGELSEASARAVIYDWIVKGGDAKGDPTEWIDAIYKETDRWPRHVHSYARIASVYLGEHGGVMTREGLREVIEKGHRRRISYYEQRVEGFYVDEIRHVAGILSEFPAGEPFDRLNMVGKLSEIYGKEASKKLFDRLLEKGIVESHKQEGYHIPIPSLHTWIVQSLAKDMETGREEARQSERMLPSGQSPE